MAELRGDLARVIDDAVSGVCSSWRPSFAARAADALLAAYPQLASTEDRCNHPDCPCQEDQ